VVSGGRAHTRLGASGNDPTGRPVALKIALHIAGATSAAVMTAKALI